MGNICCLVPKDQRSGQDVAHPRDLSISSSDESVPIRQRGVRLEVAKKVLSELNMERLRIAEEKLGRDPSPGEVIVHGYVKEEAVGQSLAVHLLQDPTTADLIGRCNVFLSHTWGTPFRDTVAALEEYEAQLPDSSLPRYYFIDFFAINQFCPSDDLEELGELAKSCETMVLFAKPWYRPAALERAWCIFELAHGILGEADLVLAFPPREKVLFKKAIDKLNSPTHAEKLLNVFTNIHTSKMQATYKKDLQEITNFMEEKMGGFQKVDQLVSSRLRKWVGFTAKALCESFSPRGTESHATFLLRAGYLFYAIGFLWEFQLETSQQARKISDKLGLSWLFELSMTNEALALQKLERYDEAVELHEEGLNTAIRKYGVHGENTQSARLCLAYCYTSIKEWDKAELQFTKTLESHKKTNRVSGCPLEIKCKLANVLRDSGKDIKRAEQMLKDVLDLKIKAYGTSIAHRSFTFIDHARCLALQGEHGRALAAYSEALPYLVQTYGEDIEEVQNLRRWIAESNEFAEKAKLRSTDL